MASLEHVRPLNSAWTARQATPPPRLDLAKVTGYHRLNRTSELVKFGGGAEGKIDNFGSGGQVAGGFTVPRPGRDKNADGLLLARSGTQMLVTAVDGNSGNGGAKVASGETLNILGRNFAEGEFNLLGAVKEANERLMQMKHSSLHILAGTTVVALLIDQRSDRLQLVHAGDSRAYLFRNGELCLLTRDHNNLDEYLRASAGRSPDAWSPAFRQLRDLLGRKDPARAYLGFEFPLINNPRISGLVHDLSLEYRRADFRHQPTQALGWPITRLTHASGKLKNGDWLIVLTDGALTSTYGQLAGAIAANSARSPYQLTTALSRMLSKTVQFGADDITIAAYHHG